MELPAVGAFTVSYVKFEKLNLKSSSEFNENWVQDRIAEDPTMFGLGDVILKDKERIQPRAGRLDILLQDADGNQRYEVEIQLGPTDESHIIRTIEYWDIERKRYPQYDHAAVIIAEDITSRFLNVISLFNGHIPLIALQMSALKAENGVGLVFTKVLDQMSFGLVDEDEEVQEASDRSYWERRGSPTTVGMADELLKLAKESDPALELKYNKFYIGLAKNGQPNNFVIFKPQKKSLRLELRIPRSDETQELLDSADIDVMDYDKRWGRYRIRLSPGELKAQHEFLKGLFVSAFQASGS